MDEKTRRLINWSRGIKEPPFEIQINPTNKCNLNCLFCRPKEYGQVREKDTISLKKWLHIIKEASEFGVKYWNILGGEPFTEPNKTLRIMEAIKKGSMSGITSTNGTLITKDIARSLINIGWDEIVFSLDSSNAETHDYLRGKKGVFKKCVNTIQLIEKYKKIKKKDKPSLQLYFVITNRNYKELSEFIDLAYSLNIKRICFQAMIETSPISKSLKLNKEELKDLQGCIKKVGAKTKEKDILTNIIDFLDCTLIEKANKTDEIIKKEISPLNTLCLEPWYMIQISPDGYANPCCNLESKKINIREKSLQEIWYSHFFKKFRKKISLGKLDKRCAVCCSGQILRNKVLKDKIHKYCKNCNAWIVEENKEIRNALNKPLIIGRVRLREYFEKFYKICSRYIKWKR